VEVNQSTDDGREHGRDRRKRLTRQSLRRATLELGLQHGLASVSIDAIAKRAGVSTRTFFNYFDTKEEAALLPLFQVSDEELAVFAEGPAETAWRDLTALFHADVERATHDREDFAAFLELHQRNPTLAGRQFAAFGAFERRLSGAVMLRLGDGPDAEVRAPLMVGCCITAVRVALERWAVSGRAPIGHLVTRTLAIVDPAFRIS
jgi:AcrR family transcriptional regulator